jgi:hypothetical protein
MSSSESERADWELAEGPGPVVGQDVPITSEPRDEEAPGVPVAPEVHHPDGEDGDSDAGLTEEHQAPADDPESGSTVGDPE